MPRRRSGCARARAGGVAVSSDATIRQRAALRSLIERRSAPALPRERQIAITRNDEAMRGYADAGMPMEQNFSIPPVTPRSTM